MGTEGGAIHACGDGFQFVRPWLTDDPNEVISIVSPSSDSLLVAFGNNSLALFALPQLILIDLLPPAWLPSNTGDITFMYVDEPGGKNFVYIGTSLGFVFVLEARGNLRICELALSPRDLGVPASAAAMAVSDIQICPKDEKYLAVGLSGSSRELGAVAVINFTAKAKAHHYQDTKAAVSSITWTHNGDTLFAGLLEYGFIYIFFYAP